ncbi:dipeptidyl aminopeptidase/acylaminoacyl peptidase [Nakamurella sp. UYEF19]|uniref:S9 family peptidase n=1 Tax=Nakamurella sp. UYEF19 TaxID=1756392 RepID=UPI003390ADB1
MTSFDDLARFTATPRITGLTLSLDGSRLVASVQSPDSKGARYLSSLWEVPLDDGHPVRLTRSEKGESAPAFRPDGSLLFVSGRPETPSTDGPDDEAALWSLPPTGEPTVVSRRAGGVGGPVVAAASGAILVSGTRLTHSTDEDDQQRRAARKDRKITAILHTGMPIRYWDHEVGDTSPRLLLQPPGGGDLVDLAPDARFELSEASYSISADGSTVASSWEPRRRGGRCPAGVVVIDVATGRRTELAVKDGWEFQGPTISPDGRVVAMGKGREGSFEHSITGGLVLMATASGEVVEPDLGDLFPAEFVWSADSATLYVAGALHGRGAILAIEPATGGVLRRLVSDASYSSLCPSPDGEKLYALRSAVDAAPHPVRLETILVEQIPVPLESPAVTDDLPGQLIELNIPAADGEPVHAWLCVPVNAEGPAPLMLWIHGGPFSSWNSWSWRWNPWVAVSQGWAVLLPDPALSTGYGQKWLDRAWPYVAAEVFADCESVLEAVIERPDIDGSRVACLGGSFGGYMTNWIAGHTNRFGAIVTHAGLWALDQQHKTTDAAAYKTGIFGEPAEHPDWYAENSPHMAAADISTPMLVIHGSRDFRVPISEALRLWWDLVSHFDRDPADLPHRFLQLTGENHWVTSPANAEIWYDTVLGFCGHHVRGQDWTPSLLL